MQKTSSYTLPDHRRITYAVYGVASSSRVVLYLHGFPGSHCEGALWDTAARQRGITLIAPDRPGFGSTETFPQRTILDWPNDVRALCDHLGLTRLAVIGVSGGGPYALACAHALPRAVASLQLVSSLAPPDAPGVFLGMASANRCMFRLMRRAPAVGRALTGALARSWAAAPELCLAWFRAFVPAADRRILDRPEIRELMLENIRTAFERGARGAREDFYRIAQPWGFAVSSIEVPTTVWHGLIDSYVPPAMGAYLARTIPQATYRTFPASGHLLAIEQIDAVLDAAVVGL